LYTLEANEEKVDGRIIVITFLASPKPFKGPVKEHQYRAIRSWQSAAPGAEVILYGNSYGIEAVEQDLSVRIQRNVASTPSGLPYFGAIAEHAAEYGKYDLQVFLNCDILLSGVFSAMQKIPYEHYLLIGQRVDLAEGVVIEVLKRFWTVDLRQYVDSGKVTLHSPAGMDYFCFRRGMWKGLPPVAIGRAGYDNALFAYCLQRKIPIIDATLSVAALHQYHDYGHVIGGHKYVWKGEEAKNNFKNAGGAWSAPMVSDSHYILQNASLQLWPCRGDRLRCIELNFRYEKNIPVVAWILRLIWRGCQAIGMKSVPQFPLREIIEAFIRLEKSNVEIIEK
jgi:hypothetical protein